MDREEIERRYRELRQQGLSHEQASDRIRQMASASRAPAPSRTGATRSSEQPARPEPEGRGAIEEFARGSALGLTQAGTSAAQGLGWLGRQAGRLIPGRDPIERAGGALEESARNLEGRAEEYFDPRGTAGGAGQFLGRLGGEIGTSVATLGLGKAGLARYAPRALQAAQRAVGGSRLRSAAASAVVDPLQYARAGAMASEGRDFGSELAIEALGGAVGGALTPFRAAQRTGRSGLAATPLTQDIPVQSIAGPDLPVQGVGGGISPFQKFIREARKQFVDGYLPIIYAIREGVGAKEARRANQLIGQKNGAGRVALREIESRLGDYMKRGDEFMDMAAQYAVAKRNLGLINKGRPTKLIDRGTGEPMTSAKAGSIIARGKQIPGVREAAQALNDHFRHLLEIQRDAGLLSRKDYRTILESEDFYVPFARSFQQAAEQKPRWYNPSFGPSARVKSMSDSVAPEFEVVNPFIVATQEGQAVYDAVAKQNLVNFIAELPEQGGLVRKVPGNYKAMPGENVVHAYVKGRRRKFLVGDDDVYNALIGQSSSSNNTFMRLARGFTTLKRNTITALPGFAALSIARDIPQYALQRRDISRALKESAAGAGIGAAVGGTAGGMSGGDADSAISGALIGAGIGSGVGGLARPTTEVASAATTLAGKTKLGRPVVEFFEPILKLAGFDLKKNRELLELWEKSGGVTESFYARGTEDARRFIQAVQRSDQSLARSIVPGMSWWETLQAIGQVAERAPRLAEFKRVMEETGEDIAESVLRSHDVTLNFSRRGVTGGKIAPYSAFFNAKMQGWDKLGRLMADPNTYKLAVPMLLAPTVALWNINKDNPDYWGRPDWEKNLFWLIPSSKVEGGFVRVPKPFELGTAFASSFERLLDRVAMSNREEGSVVPAAPDVSVPEALLGLVKTAGTFATSEGVVLPDVIVPAAQQLWNKDFFTGREIVPFAQQSLPAPYQYDEGTSAIARLAGETVGASPMRVDQLIGDVFGTVGRRTQDVLVDPAARALGLPAPIDETPEQGLVGRGAELLGARRFATKDYAVSQIEYNARKRLDRLSATKRQLDRLINEGEDRRVVAGFIEENEDLLRELAGVNSLRLALSRINRIRRNIARDRSISDLERMDAINQLREQADQISIEILAAGR